MKVRCEEYVRLTEEYVWKLDVISTAYEEEVSKKQMVEGGIDLMFSTALKVLYKSGEITEEGLEYALELLDEDVAVDIREQLAAADK